jgi:integrase
MVTKSSRRTDNAKALTEDRARKEKPPAAGRTYIYDTAQPGLALCITAAGSRSFYFVKRLAGKFVRTPIGKVGELSLADARGTVTRMLSDHIVKGVDPIEEKQRQAAESARQSATFGALWLHYLESHAKPKKRTWREDEKRYSRHLQKWEKKALDAIDQDDVDRLHRTIGKTAPYEANRTLALIHTMFAKAGKMFSGRNPAEGIEKFQEESREVFLHGDEMPRFFAALQELRVTSPTSADALEMCVWTGARSKSNVCAMRWDELNVDRAIWTIPGGKHKNGKPVTVPLVPQALAILERRKAQAAGAFVFPGRRRGQPLKHLQRPWEDLCKAAKLKGVRIHDLRRTAGSWMAAGGTSLHIVGKALGHRTASATAVYARLDLDPVRAAISAAADAIQAASKVEGNGHAK